MTSQTLKHLTLLSLAFCALSLPHNPLPSSPTLPSLGTHLKKGRSIEAQRSYPRSVKRSTSSETSSPLSSNEHSAILRPLQADFQPPAVQVTINGIPRWMVIDTGSADTVIYTENTTCIVDDHQKPQADCYFGDLYYGSYKPIKDMVFNQTYGTGQTISGQFGYATLTVAGITIDKQIVAFATTASPNPFNGTSGILGLAPHNVEAAFSAAEPSQASVDNQVFYSTVFESMYNVTKQIDPYFAIALEPDPVGGYLSFGSTSPISSNSSFVNVPLQGIEIGNSTNKHVYYPVQPDGYMLNGKRHNTTYRVAVDSGTFVNRLPTDVADTINAAFNPPAKYNAKSSFYVTSCNATIPKFGLAIGGKTFSFSAETLLLPVPTLSDVCVTSVTRGFDVSKALFPYGFYVLGDMFLNNVVAVFDVGKAEMRFAEHQTIV